MVNVLAEQVSNLLEEALQQLGVGDVDPGELLEVPPRSEMGDYAFPCFQLARRLRKAPPAIAAELAGLLSTMESGMQKIEVVGPYVNFFVDPASASDRILRAILDNAPGYGAPQSPNGRRVVIDFSSPNIAKPFHVGHLRSTMIGNSLARLFEYHGYEVVRLNYLGDWGTQFGKLIVAYRRWGSAADLEKEPIKGLLALYVRFHQEAEQEPALDDEARAAFRALEEGSEEERRLWEWFRDLSLREFNKHYERLGVHFDTYAGESAYNEKVAQTVSELEMKGLLTQSEGALVVELEDLPPCLIRKKDGAALYATRDVSAAIDRYETYGFEHLFYVVGSPQQLHFKQVFSVLRLLGYEWVDRAEHIPFGQIRIGDEQLSTRRGNVVFLEELLDQAVARVRAIIEERNSELDAKDEVAEAVGVGAIVFNDLFHNRIKDISFDWESVLSFEGDTGPYVQYTHARAASLIRRSHDDLGEPDSSWIDASQLDEPETFQLVKRLAEYPDVLKRAQEEREPSEIARYAILVCHDFNSFYHAHRIFGTSEERSRLALVAAVKRLLADALRLLGVKAPEAM